MTEEPVEDQLKRMFGKDDLKRMFGMEPLLEIAELQRKIRDLNEKLQRPVKKDKI